MEIHNNEVKTCLTMGHLYTSVIVVRCPHLEAYEATVRTWRDTPDGGTEVAFGQSIAFGPFDDEAMVIRAVSVLCAGAVEALTALAPI